MRSRIRGRGLPRLATPFYIDFAALLVGIEILQLRYDSSIGISSFRCTSVLIVEDGAVFSSRYLTALPRTAGWIPLSSSKRRHNAAAAKASSILNNNHKPQTPN
ncbi:hypothetical protein V502_07974 [Pseudogymnoascus sp. VKM F-4520 (FW-2644)]|nr:hypothetical protein V502_07974 [Pseudogymnoascus sp. VKM F-4520 (FW-2644)]